MIKRKKIKTKGKIQLSRYFQDLRVGDLVSVVRELSIPANFPLRMQGRTGVVEGKRGRAFIVRIKDQNKEKKFLIEPIHLKKVKTQIIK
ncbi:MAG: 50S ribosomal protein L21e [Candidatus Pacearchaeota archaeon]